MKRTAFSPSLVISLIALIVALGGSVYATTTNRITGRAIRISSMPGNRVAPKSLPGNRLKLHSLAANRLKPGLLEALGLHLPLTGAEINVQALGRVPNAEHAQTSDSATHALEADSARTAESLTGDIVGCPTETELFAGACWQTATSPSAATAPEAAAECARQGGSLPAGLQLMAFAGEPGITLEGTEWASEIESGTGPGMYTVVTVNDAGVVNATLPTSAEHYRCVIPLLRQG